MKQIRYMMISVLAMLMLTINLDAESFAEQDKKLILIINSHTEDYSWTNDVLKGIFKTINPSELDANIYMENFDYKYYRKGDIEEDIYKLIKDKYSDKKIDLVITTDLKATEFAIDYRDKLFKDTPIAFSGISKYKAREITKGVDNISGVIERPNIEQTLKTALKISPHAKNIYVIHDNSSQGEGSFKEIKKVALELKDDLNIETLKNIGDIKSDVNLPKISKDSIVIGTIYLEDEKGMTVSMSEVAEKLSREIDLPIFYLQESTIGHGVLGGSMLSPELHGVNTGKLALRILNGENLSKIGFIEDNNSNNVYDYNIMKKFDISEDLLPKDSNILNKPSNPYEEYREQLIAIGIIMGLLIIFVIYLSVNIRKRKQAEKELEIIAYYDEITGLPNRNMFYKNMNKKLKEKSGALLYLDIDNFKDINDTFGHTFGDLVLKEVANRLLTINSIDGKLDTIYRISGDEYLLDLEEKDKNYSEEVARQIRTELLKQLTINKQDVRVSVSIGIVFYPEDSRSIENLFKKVELSMYKAKSLGRNGYVVYEDSMEKEVAERTLLENNLRLALERDEFVLNYQPQIDPFSGDLVGFEALVRWHSSEYGLVPPDKFIPISEDTGEIVKIGEWILREACKFTLDINKRFNTEIEVSVNISPVQLKQADFIDMLKRTIKEVGVESKVIGIEVTETALMESFEDGLGKLEILKDMGFNIYLDDFGTGYSSLNYLLKLPINTIKIDKSFVDDIMTNEKGRKITENIINIAHDMDLNVVAEGVEEKEQLLTLKEIKCDIIQGYIFGKPLSDSDAKDFIKDNIKRQ